MSYGHSLGGATASSALSNGGNGMVASAIATVLAAGISSSIAAGSANAMNERTLRANRQAMRDQALMDRWFAENTHQMEVGDLRKAGLNPVLSAHGNTSTQSVGLTSAPQGDTIDPQLGQLLNGAIANMNSAKSVESQNQVNDASIDLINQQAQTEVDKRTNLQSQTEFNNLQSMGKAIENEHLPAMIKSQIENNVSSAKAGLINAYANQVGAKANMINATDGSLTKTVNKYIKEPETFTEDANNVIKTLLKLNSHNSSSKGIKQASMLLKKGMNKKK